MFLIYLSIIIIMMVVILIVDIIVIILKSLFIWEAEEAREKEHRSRGGEAEGQAGSLAEEGAQHGALSQDPDTMARGETIRCFTNRFFKTFKCMMVAILNAF